MFKSIVILTVLFITFFSYSSELEQKLIEAIYNDDLEHIKICLDYKPNINFIDDSGLSVLDHLIYLSGTKNRYDIIKLLIEKGLDLNKKDTKGYTLLMYFSVFFKHEINFNLQENDLYKASDYKNTFSPEQRKNNTKREIFELINLIIEKGAYINERNKDGETALMMACDCGEMEIVDILLKNKADINAADHKGFTPLIYAAQNGNLEIIKLILKKGADKSIKDNEGQSALFRAVIKGHTDAANYLVLNGANINEKDMKGRTPLIYSIINYDIGINIANFLILNGANINEKDNNKLTPLMYAILKNNIAMTGFLLDKKVSVNNILEYDNNKIEHHELNNFSIVNIEYDMTFIKQMDQRLSDDYYLLNNKDENFEKKKYRSNELTVAIKSDGIDFADLLLDNNIDLNFRDNNGFTAFMTACLLNKFDIAEKILSKGGNINDKDDNGNNLLIYAVKEENHLKYDDNKKLFDFVIGKGIDITEKNSSGKTALDYARKNKMNKEFLKILKQELKKKK